MENKTKTGLILLIIGIILGIISNSIFFIDSNTAIGVSALGSIGGSSYFYWYNIDDIGQKRIH